MVRKDEINQKGPILIYKDSAHKCDQIGQYLNYYGRFGCVDKVAQN